MSFTLTILRHGKTMANEKKLYCGHTDIGLSSGGVQGIKDNIRLGRYPEGDLFYTSGMKRTVETLQLIYGKEVPYKAVEGLKEYNLGRIEMKSYEELKENQAYRRWAGDETLMVHCPGGESRYEFNLRVKLAFFTLTNELRAASNANSVRAVLVTHGGVIAEIMGVLFPGGNNFYDWQPAPGLGYILDYGGEGYTGYQYIGGANM